MMQVLHGLVSHLGIPLELVHPWLISFRIVACSPKPARSCLLVPGLLGGVAFLAAWRKGSKPTPGVTWKKAIH